MQIKRNDNTVLLVLRRHIQSIRVFFQNTDVSVDIDTSDGLMTGTATYTRSSITGMLMQKSNFENRSSFYLERLGITYIWR